MIEADVLLGIVLVVAFLTLASVGMGFLLGRTSTTAPLDPYRRESRDPGYDGMFHSETTTWKEEPEDDYSRDWNGNPLPEEKHATLPINPDAPPTWKTYNPRSQDAPPKFCRCHGVEVQREQRVLWWPNPETGGVDLLCEQGVEEAERMKKA